MRIEMFIRHSSMVYVRGRPSDLGLGREDDLNHCGGKLTCDHVKFVLLQYKYGSNLFSRPRNCCILPLPSLHKGFFNFYKKTFVYVHIYNSILNVHTLLLSFQAYFLVYKCGTPFHEECPKHHEHKEDPGVTPGTCGAVGERTQVILVWVRTRGIGNASHPWRLGGTRIKP